MNPTERFSNRVDAYDAYRPGYPLEVLGVVRGRTHLADHAVVADIGAGTGISSLLFLSEDSTVYAVEPNAAMRAAAKKRFEAYPHFFPIDGTAEATTLQPASVDLIVAGQAFHWFDKPRAKAEFARILRPNGWVVLMWNTRRTDTPSGRAYEDILHEFGTDYYQTRHENITPQEFAEFFAPGSYEKVVLPNEQRLDRAGVLGRLRSVSYLPPEGDPRYSAMATAADRLFDEHQSGGIVTFAYNTELYIGQLHAQGHP